MSEAPDPTAPAASGPTGAPLAPVAAPERIAEMDVLRGFALLGILLMNVEFFFRPLQDLFGWSRLTVGGGLYVISLLSALYSPLAARIMDSAGIRRTMILGACALSLGFALLHFIQNLWQYYLVLGLFVAFGADCMGALPSNTVVAHWFERKRGKALGIATMGLSLLRP